MTADISTLTMLHLGLGSFHRAHQALYLHQLQQSGDRRWTLAGGNIRPDMPETMAALGYEGQRIIVDPTRDLVVVHLGKWVAETQPELDRHLTSIVESFPVDSFRVAR